MPFKWAGALIILAATTVWGNQQAALLQRRVRQLEEFRLALRLLAAEIGYTATPLPRALEEVRGRLRDKEVQNFFADVGNALRNPETGDAASAWLQAVQRRRGRLALVQDDWPVVMRAAAGLGGLGRENQIKQLEAAEAQLAAHTASAAALSESGARMWRYLGVMGGTALVILLL
jgi:stage III sporulation protein AB